MTKTLQSLLSFAIDTAVAAGKITVEHFSTDINTSIKSDGTPVTEVDQKTEAFIRWRIEKQYPRHEIVGEEYGLAGKDNASFRWFIDPIDGTNYYVRGVPLYSTLIGLEIDGTIDVGVVYLPATGDLLAAATGLGCWWNGKPVRVSKIDRLEKGIVAYSDLANFYKQNCQAVFERVVRSSHYRVGWSDAYGYLMVATGRADVMIEAAVSVWDVAPYPVIFREAGGFFGDWKGEETIYSPQVMATNQALNGQMVSLLSI